MRSLADSVQGVVNAEDAAVLARRRRGRNVALLVALLGLAALFYAIAMVKMAQSGHAP